MTTNLIIFFIIAYFLIGAVIDTVAGAEGIGQTLFCVIFWPIIMVSVGMVCVYLLLCAMVTEILRWLGRLLR